MMLMNHESTAAARRGTRLSAPALLFAAALLAAWLGQRPAAAVEVTSPSGQMTAVFAVKDFEGQSGSLVWSVRFQGKCVMVPSRLGLELGEQTLQSGFTVIRETTGAHNQQWKPVCGERSLIRDHYRQLTVELRQTAAPHRLLEIEFRAYDEGVAVCYRLPKQVGLDRATIPRELTEFRFPADHRAWAVYSAQGKYREVAVSEIKRGCERPLVLRASDDCYLAVGEARLVDYARMKFSPLADCKHGLISSLDGPVESPLPLTTPWRLVMAAKTPGRLLENNSLFLNLNAPCALRDTSWIKPGKVIREATLTTQGGKACVDFAARRKIEYVEFDAGWYGPEDSPESDATQVNVDPARSKGPLDLQAVLHYAKQRGVGILLYVNHRALERQLDAILPLYKQWGVKGIKYGFVNVGSQRWTAWLHEAVRKTAEHQLLIDIHDEYRPTGYSRTYPNLLTQEGIAGDETSPTNGLTLTILFTRMLCGPADNTVCYYAPRVEQNATHAYQLAKPVCLFSPFQFLYWYDRPPAAPHKTGGAGNSQSLIGDEPELEFYDHLPTVWDDTRVLAGAIGEYSLLARRSGQRWFVGAMNSGVERTLEARLSFLDKGRRYVAHVYSDDPRVKTRTHVRIDRLDVSADTVLPIRLSAQGGQALRIEPAAAAAVGK